MPFLFAILVVRAFMEANLSRIHMFVRTHRLEVGVFIFALTVRLALIVFYLAYGDGSYNWGADGGDYVNEAKNILEGHGFSRSWAPPYLPDAIRTPLYPLFLAGVYSLFGSFAAALFVEAAISSLLPVLFVRMAQFFVRTRTVLLSGALFLSVEPHLVYNTTFFGTEGISIILVTWGLFELLKSVEGSRPRKATLRAGFALGLATLARPITTYLPIFLLPLYVYQGYRAKNVRGLLKPFVLFLTVFLLTLSPWLIRNYIVFDTAGMSTVGWFNVYTRLAATVQAIDTGDDFYTSYHKVLDELSIRGHVTHPPPVTEFEIQDPRFASVLQQESLRILGEHKGALGIYLLTYPIAVLTQDNTLGYIGYFGFTDVVRPPFSPTLFLAQHGPFETIKAVLPYLRGPYLVPYFMRALFFALFIASAIGAWLLWQRDRRFAALLLFGFIGYVVLFSLNAGGQIDGRYRSQFLIGETVLAAITCEWVLTKRKGMRA